MGKRSEPSSRIRVGLIGANGQADRWGSRIHVPVFNSLPEVELVAVCTAHEDTARIAAERAGVSKAYSDYRQLIADQEVDLVSVVVQDTDHEAIVMAAIAAGKHVLCEWPLALNVKQAETMAQAARGAGVMTGVVLQGRYSPGILHMRKLIMDGYVGQILTWNLTNFVPVHIQGMRHHRAWIADADRGGGALHRQGGHGIDSLEWCLGPLEAVCAWTGTLLPEWTLTDEEGYPLDKTVKVSSVDSIGFLGRLGGGVRGVGHVSSVAWHGQGWRLEVYGTEGKLICGRQTEGRESAEYHGFQTQQTWEPLGVWGARGSIEKGRGTLPQLPGDEIPIPKEFYSVSELTEGQVPFNVAQLVRAFVGSIRKGTRFAPNFDDAVHLHRVLAAVAESDRQGSWISLS